MTIKEKRPKKGNHFNKKELLLLILPVLGLIISEKIDFPEKFFSSNQKAIQDLIKCTDKEQIKKMISNSNRKIAFAHLQIEEYWKMHTEEEENYVTLAEQLMGEVPPIGAILEIEPNSLLFGYEDLEKPLKPNLPLDLPRMNGAVVYLDSDGNKYVATSDYQIIEANGFGYTYIGCLTLNEYSKKETDYEGLYKKENIHPIDVEKESSFTY